MSTPPTVAPRPAVIGTTLRLLTFRLSRDELLALDRRHLALGFALTWLVGIGRTWDDPRATLVHKSGLGSVVYVCVLAALLWLTVAPLRTPATNHVGYLTLLTFVALTAPPAALYAIPIERFVSVDTAIAVNLALLAVVATWRIALLAYFLSRAVGLRAPQVAVATLAPPVFIVSALTILKLSEGVIEIMAGVRERRPDDAVNGALLGMTLISSYVAVPLALAYAALAWHSWRLRVKGSATTRD